jgi:class 3 adenylate cyclase
VSRFPPETHYVEVNGGQVGYQVIGEGPIDVVVGSASGHNIDLAWDLAPYAAYARSLASIGRRIAFDPRGSGVSDPISREAPPTWEDWTEDLRAVLDAVESRRAAVLAYLDSGPVAILFAAMQPERVSQLVLVNTSARVLWDDDYPIGVSSSDWDSTIAMVEEAWATPEFARALFPSRADDAEFLRLFARILRASASPRRAAAQLDYMARYLDVREALPVIQAPTLVIRSRDYLGTPLAHGRYLADHIPGARFVELPGGDAFPYEEVFDEVAEFLTGERPSAPIDRILATVLFTDIVDSTARAAAVGDQRWRSTLDAHDRAVRQQLRRFRGNEINTTGDGFVASFDGPARAIRCAEAISEATQHLGIEIRSGLHTGECEVRGDDLGGLAVHIAARVAALACPGDVLVSSTVKDLVAGSGIEFEDRGEHDLKGVPGTWRLYAVQT